MTDIPDINRAIRDGIDRGIYEVTEDTCYRCKRRDRGASSLLCEDCQCDEEERTGLPGFTGRTW